MIIEIDLCRLCFTILGLTYLILAIIGTGGHS